MRIKNGRISDFELVHSSTGNWPTAWPIRRTSRGQSSLEMSAALILVLILLVGAVKLFLWLNASLVYRQSDYEKSRVAAGSTPLTGVSLTSQSDTKGVEVDESAYPKLDIFR
jgi:hypothetical protein